MTTAASGTHLSSAEGHVFRLLLARQVLDDATRCVDQLLALENSLKPRWLGTPVFEAAPLIAHCMERVSTVFEATTSVLVDLRPELTPVDGQRPGWATLKFLQDQRLRSGLEQSRRDLLVHQGLRQHRDMDKSILELLNVDAVVPYTSPRLQLGREFGDFAKQPVVCLVVRARNAAARWWQTVAHYFNKLQERTDGVMVQTDNLLT